MFIFPRKQQWWHLFGCETQANRAIRTWYNFQGNAIKLGLFGVFTRFSCVEGPLGSPKDDVTIGFTIMTSYANCLKPHKMFT